MHIREKKITIWSKIFGVFVLCIMTTIVFSSEDIPPLEKVFKNSVCVQCHEKQNNVLIDDWRNSAHAKVTPVVDCVSCHGMSHQDVVSNARGDKKCIGCHGGEADPVVHSYSSSKHGVLMRLEKNTYDWDQPFKLANYRTPGCGYCHMHQGGHNVSETVRPDLMSEPGIEKVQDVTRAVCQDCHSPRYITRLLSNGESMLEIGRKKVREADALIKQAESEFSEAVLEPVRLQMVKMRQHLHNVGLGVGHQSPDYQWWHGQPALDGDLLRIKDSISELRRASFLAN